MKLPEQENYRLNNSTRDPPPQGPINVGSDPCFQGGGQRKKSSKKKQRPLDALQ